MHMLYDSDSFVVVHMLADAGLSAPASNDTTPPEPPLAPPAPETVATRTRHAAYLDGSRAEMFQQQIQAWQREAPTQEEVEDILDRYTGLAQNPVVVH